MKREVWRRAAATIYMIVESCKRANVDPYTYLADVLLRVATHPASPRRRPRPRELEAPRGGGRALTAPRNASPRLASPRCLVGRLPRTAQYSVRVGPTERTTRPSRSQRFSYRFSSLRDREWLLKQCAVGSICRSRERFTGVP